MNAGYVEHLKKLGYEASVPMRGKIEEWHGWYTASNAWYVSEERSAADRRTYRVDRLSMQASAHGVPGVGGAAHERADRSGMRRRGLQCLA